MDAEVLPTATQAARYSRYRSVRKAISREETGAPPVPVQVSEELPEDDQQAQISRTPSRYRRTHKPRVHHVPLPTNNVIPHVTVPKSHSPVAEFQPKPQVAPAQTSVSSSSSQRPKQRRVYTSPQVAESRRQHDDLPRDHAVHGTRQRSKTMSASSERTPTFRRSFDAAREEARMILEGEYDKLQRMKEQQQQAERDRRIRAEARAVAQAKVDMERVKAEARLGREGGQDKVQRSQSRTPDSSSQRSHPGTAFVPEKMSGPTQEPVRHSSRRERDTYSLRLKENPVQPEFDVRPCATKCRDQPAVERQDRRPTTSKSKSAPVSATVYSPMAGDGPSETGVHLPKAIDAPVSAINSGERRVEVRFETSRLTLPITPSTTVEELFKSASVTISRSIDPLTSVMVETYRPLGLERPLRRYEHIRDVMNSWDSDSQNYLTIMPGSEVAAKGLEQKEAPIRQPDLTMLNLYHSQRPGKWEKHWMVLKSDGQVTASKTENDGNAPNVFHLSDFDVYIPTRKQIKRLRPPKKVCFAIKSQQRSILFESTENFVHFFATNDKVLADLWYNALQSWRSWYLVYVLGEGTAPKPQPVPNARPETSAQPRPSTAQSKGSSGTSRSRPDCSATAFRYRDEQTPSTTMVVVQATNLPQRSRTLNDHRRSRSMQEMQTASPHRRLTMKRHTPPTSFPQRALLDELRHTNENTTIGAGIGSTNAGFTGTGLLARQRSIKKIGTEGPATIYENAADAFTGTGLLSHKQSIKKFANDNIIVPIDTNDAFTGGGLLARSMSTKKHNTNNEFVPENTNDAFTGGGLLRSVTKKRSTVARPGQPFLELNTESEFVNGSLLQQVETFNISQGLHAPAIDRSKGIEITDRTGEF